MEAAHVVELWVTAQEPHMADARVVLGTFCICKWHWVVDGEDV